jgi:predicted nucleic acid-binding protein
MKNFYMDSSVLVPLYCEEVHSERIEKQVEDMSERWVSELSNAEMASALRLKTDLGELSREGGYAAWSKYLEHVNGGLFKTIHIGPMDWVRTLELAWSLPQRCKTLDNLHLALAEREELQLASADKKQIRAARELGIPSMSFGT